MLSFLVRHHLCGGGNGCFEGAQEKGKAYKDKEGEEREEGKEGEEEQKVKEKDPILVFGLLMQICYSCMEALHDDKLGTVSTQPLMSKSGLALEELQHL